MGSVDQVKEACRDMRTLRPVEHFLRDPLGESEPRLAVGAIETTDGRVARSIAVDRLLSWLTWRLVPRHSAWRVWVSTGRFRTRSSDGLPSWEYGSRLAPTAGLCSG